MDSKTGVKEDQRISTIKATLQKFMEIIGYFIFEFGYPKDKDKLIVGFRDKNYDLELKFKLKKRK